VSVSDFRVIPPWCCCASIPEHSPPRCSENFIHPVAAAVIPKSLFYAVAGRPQPGSTTIELFSFLILLNDLI